MICKKCNEKINDNNKFCSNCENKILYLTESVLKNENYENKSAILRIAGFLIVPISFIAMFIFSEEISRFGLEKIAMVSIIWVIPFIAICLIFYSTLFQIYKGKPKKFLKNIKEYLKNKYKIIQINLLSLFKKITRKSVYLYSIGTIFMFIVIWLDENNKIKDIPDVAFGLLIVSIFITAIMSLFRKTKEINKFDLLGYIYISLTIALLLVSLNNNLKLF